VDLSWNDFTGAIVSLMQLVLLPLVAMHVFDEML
jgi:hypothetical protein